MQLSSVDFPAERIAPAGFRRDPEVDACFVNMLDAYRPTGGMARAEDVVGMLRARNKDGLATVARWIAAAQVVNCEWNGEYWLPLFQFVAPGMRPHPGLQRVLAELSPVLDPWDITLWFARPNPWLGEVLPAAALATRCAQVEQAARADRFAFRG
jgi:hypothetical protein